MSMQLVEQPADADPGSAGKFRKNALSRSEWTGPPGSRVLRYTWRDGITYVFKPSLATQAVTDTAREVGFQVTLDRCMAVEVDEYPNTEHRMQEGRRRLRARGNGWMSGGSWTLERTASGPLESDVIAALARFKGCSPDEASAMVDTLAGKRNVERSAGLRLIAESKQVAAIIIDIETERRKLAGDRHRDDAEDILAEIEGG
jgi:hypothetical protein